ncbi:protein PF3D7_1417600-like isoform X2 [Condylostylus longicornis]|uniref:protein PF3D7_1417600-like isoform X2 n=1 Tax=Condylostylus longicornis TaxID=2530218 RepID=UPI00244DA761|nr:protein PF3D7_1417600-like isoform X2 [Condylostylus longicornis]
MTSSVGLKKIESNTTTLSSTAEDCGNNNNDNSGNANNIIMSDDIAISPIEGYSEVKEIPSPYSKIVNVCSSSGESTPTANGSVENIMIITNSSETSTISLTKTTSSITNTTTIANSVTSPVIAGIINSPSSIIANRNFCTMSGINDMPQWKKDLIARKKSNNSKTNETKQQFETVANSTVKNANEQSPSFLFKKLSPVTSTSKSINSFTVKSPVTLLSKSSSVNLNSNQSISSNKISCITSSTKDVAFDNTSRKSSMKTNQSSTIALSEGINDNSNNNINTSQQEFNIIKEDTKQSNKSSLATSTSATNEQLLSKDDSTPDNNVSSCTRNQMPVKFNNVKSVANKYKENLILNLSITPSSSSLPSSLSTLLPSTTKSSTSVVKTIVGEITSKGQYTNSSNKMIDSSNTIIKSEILNHNMAATTITTTTDSTSSTTMASLQQQPFKSGKISNRIGIQTLEENKNDIDETKACEINVESVSNDTTTIAPPIPMRRTSLNQQHKIEQQQLKNYMATSLQNKSDNMLNINNENSMEVDLQQHFTLLEQKQQNERNIPSKEIEDENENETEQKILLLTNANANQLHSRYESNKFGITPCEVDDYALNKNKLLKTSIASNSNCSDSKTKKDKIESINDSGLTIIDGDGSNSGNFDEIINTGNLENFINNKSLNDLMNNSDDKIGNDFLSDNNKTYGNVSLLNFNVKKSLPQSLQLSAAAISSNSIKPLQQSYHHQGYIKNPTVNKNSTATINKYIAAAAAKNHNTTTSINNSNIDSNNIFKKKSISPSTSPSSSPKKNLLLNSCFVTTTAATTKLLTTTIVTNTTSSLPSSSSSLISSPSSSSSSSLLSNYKQQQNKNIQNLVSSNNKMVAVPEIQLKSNSSSKSAGANGESSNNVADSSVTTTINNAKTTAVINNSNNNLKRTKMIDNVKNTKSKDDEFNDFDPSEELEYGPGIVSKLRCRYLSLALRQSTGKQRLPLDNLRRATSLNNLLDGGSGTNVVNKVNGACGTTNKSKNNHNNDNNVIDEDDNDYEHLIINSNHNHYINNKNRNQKILSQQQNGLSNNLKEIKEQDVVKTLTENSCSSSLSPSSSRNTTITADINAGSLLLTINDNVEKPEYQQDEQQQQQQKNSFISKNIQQTSADGAISTAIGKNSVSAIIAEKNLLNKTGCNTNFDQYQHYQQQQNYNNQQPNQYIRNTAAAVAAGIIRSGRQVKRGNDSIKRARSVEALLCEKPDIWSGNIDINADTDNTVLNDIDELKDNKICNKKDNIIMSNSAYAALYYNNNSNNASSVNCNIPSNSNGSPILTEVTIEDKILNAREQRKHEKHPPKRLTSVIDDTERPPPDVVKQTLKIFEASANRRGGRGISKNHQSGHVAMKVANYKSIISQDQKPPISYPKPPLSPKRLGTLNNTAVTNGVKSKPNTLNIQNGSALNTNNNNKKFNKNSPKVSSPVSNLTKRFNNQNSEDSAVNEIINKSPVPLNSIASPTTLNHAAYLRNRNESTPIRTTQQIRAPDIIPRKLFDNNLGISPVIDTENLQSTNNNVVDNSTTDSPITQITKRMDRLKIETPSPTLLNSNSSVVSSQGDATTTPIKVYHPNNKSSGSESTDYDDEIYSYDVTAVDEDDADDDDDSVDGDNDMIVKKISKTALENISKAGSSQCFSFKNVKTTPLIGINPTTSAEHITPTPAPKQVGIIRPLVAEPKIITNISSNITSDIMSSVNNSQTDKLKLTSINDNVTDKSAKILPIIQENLPPQPKKRSSIGIDQDHSITSGGNIDNNLVITNINQNQTKLASSSVSNNINNKNISILESNSSDNNIKPALTSREIEKNLINEKKNELANLENSGNSNIITATGTITATSTANINNNNSNNNELNNWQQQLIQKKKNSNNSTGPIETQNNIMVFNFKDRKEVPDYIENDGLFIKRKRELPKPNESGFVLLGDLSLETSTDPDDSWTMGPPSPCNVEFENANIIIDGKSSLRFRSRDGSLRVQFDDTLTSTFEYPSESSLLDEFALTPNDSFYATNSNETDQIDNKSHNIEAEELIPIQMLSSSTSSSATTITSPLPTHTKSLGNMPIDNQKTKEEIITPIKITTAIIPSINSDAIISTVKILRPSDPPPPIPPTRTKILKIVSEKPMSVLTTAIATATTATTSAATANFYQLQSKSLTLPLTNKNLLEKDKIKIKSNILLSPTNLQPTPQPPPPPVPLNKPINFKPKPLLSSSSFSSSNKTISPINFKPLTQISSSLNKFNIIATTNIKPFSSSIFQSPLVVPINATITNDKFKLNTTNNSNISTPSISTTTSVKSRILQFQKLESESAKSRNILLKIETSKCSSNKTNNNKNNSGLLKLQKTETSSIIIPSTTTDNSRTDQDKNSSNSVVFNSLISIGTESIV